MSAPMPSALVLAQSLFAAHQLPFPPVPQDLAGKLAARSDWVFATRTDTPTPYDLDWFLQEYQDGRVTEDYLIFGHDGHGFNSYAMHYYLVRGPLAVFEQLAWGGVYTDNTAAVEMMEVYFAQTTALIRLLDQARAAGRIGTSERLVLITSDYGESRWTFGDGGRGRLTGATGWHREGDGLRALLSSVLAAHDLAGS